MELNFEGKNCIRCGIQASGFDQEGHKCILCITEIKFNRDSIEKRLERMEYALCTVLDNNRKYEEMIETVLHAVCESNDKKTKEAIKKYLNSEFGNRCR